MVFARGLRNLITRLRREDRGQDLVEYGLLTAIIGISSLLLFTTFQPRMASVYLGWNTAQEAAWEPCDPGGCP